jgi:hypothetical protein
MLSRVFFLALAHSPHVSCWRVVGLGSRFKAILLISGWGELQSGKPLWHADRYGSWISFSTVNSTPMHLPWGAIHDVL